MSELTTSVREFSKAVTQLEREKNALEKRCAGLQVRLERMKAKLYGEQPKAKQMKVTKAKVKAAAKPTKVKKPVTKTVKATVKAKPAKKVVKKTQASAFIL